MTRNTIDLSHCQTSAHTDKSKKFLQLVDFIISLTKVFVEIFHCQDLEKYVTLFSGEFNVEDVCLGQTKNMTNNYHVTFL